MTAVKFGLSVISFVVFAAWAGARIYAGIHYDTSLGDYIAQAATSPTPSIAAAKLDTAIAEIEREGWTSGNTGIFFTYPTNDVGFWYQRLVDSRTILNALPANDSPLEISNTMMRVHESIAGTGQHGGYILDPKGISIYPHNVAFFWWGTLSFLLGCVFFAFGAIEALA